MKRKMCLWFVSTLLLGGGLFQSCAYAENWVPVYYTPSTANPYSRFTTYADISSFETGEVDGVTYYSVRTKLVRLIGGNTTIEDLSVICDNNSYAPALSIRRLGTMSPEGKIAFNLDFGEVKSLQDFNFRNLDKVLSDDMFSKKVFAICLLKQEQDGKT